MLKEVSNLLERNLRQTLLLLLLKDENYYNLFWYYCSCYSRACSVHENTLQDSIWLYTKDQAPSLNLLTLYSSNSRGNFEAVVAELSTEVRITFSFNQSTMQFCSHFPSTSGECSERGNQKKEKNLNCTNK